MARQFASSNQRCAVQGRPPRGRWAGVDGRKKEGTDVAFGIEGEGGGIKGAGIGRGLPCAALIMAVAAATAAAAAASAAVAAVVGLKARLTQADARLDENWAA